MDLTKVQASFRLQKSVSELLPHIGRLEYDIYGEIGVPDTKVAILSMHRAATYNWTNVVFGVLSDPIDVPINPVSLSVLRSSLVELFLQQSNLTLTNSTFGQPSLFEILKFPGELTVIPDQSASIWQISQILFNFTLNNSICEIKENLVELKEQLTWGLHLRAYENVYVQITNRNGSTRDPPVTLQAAVMSELGSLLPKRLKQLAQTITGSPANNLGLSNSVFGKVKEISLSSYLNRTIHATPPIPSPAPAPGQNDYGDHSFSPSPNLSPSPAPSPDFQHHLPPCFNCDASSPSDDNPYSPCPENDPHDSLPPISSSPEPSLGGTHSPRPSPRCGSTIPPSLSPTSNSNPTAPSAFPPRSPSSYPPPVDPSPQLSPNASPLPAVSYGSSPRQEKENAKRLASPPIASPSISTSLSYPLENLCGFYELLRQTVNPIVRLVKCHAALYTVFCFRLYPDSDSFKNALYSRRSKAHTSYSIVYRCLLRAGSQTALRTCCTVEGPKLTLLNYFPHASPSDMRQVNELVTSPHLIHLGLESQESRPLNLGYCHHILSQGQSFLQGDMVTWFLWTPDIPSPMVVTMIHSRPNFPSVQHTAAYSFAPAIG
ncbi:hypothetical protein Acr_10g0001170 [Actinidia rufa]|uniref:DUF7036 domain-containing protein n=1 Tax=Actinidia rufa TaxID=165716 RepID=A0A7J0F7P5_9ERIC|nr:hypothetical protein Acr_10g0001170 [Actinidia rufa]